MSSKAYIDCWLLNAMV